MNDLIYSLYDDNDDDNDDNNNNFLPLPAAAITPER